MADNWSPSTLTLASLGDWCEWTLDVPDSATADALNGLAGTVLFAIRGAFPGPSITISPLRVIVNHSWVLNTTSDGSPSGWLSADRFERVQSCGSLDASRGFVTSNVEDPAGDVGGPFSFTDPTVHGIAGPFVVGTNTIRILQAGATAMEIDFFYACTGPSVTLPALGFGDAAESPPTGFASHVDPNVDTSLNAGQDHQWILKAPDATTGHADFALITPRKFCPRAVGVTVTTKVLLTDIGGTPLPGETVWLYDVNTASLISATTDGDGIAELDLSSADIAAYFWLGNTDLMACAITVGATERINCGGWHVGNVGIG